MENKQTYTGISIGPIVATLSEVRKPRHLWSASYLFSHLMEIIIEEGINLGGALVSPATLEDIIKKMEEENPGIRVNKKLGIGLYPDRVFFKGKIEVASLTKNALKALSTSIGICEDKLNTYFNIMGVSVDADTESKAISELNQKLDILELANRCEISKDRQEILSLISRRKKSPLFREGFGNENFDIEYLALIAAKELEYKSKEDWESIKETVAKYDDKKKEDTKVYLGINFITKEDYLDFIDETDFYKQIGKNKTLKEYFKSYHKYFCVVQADGDNMGKVIGNLKDDKLKELSQTLISFGKVASQKVKNFGGLPIYAGGDDLLFIAPVVSYMKDERDMVIKERLNIFDLIKEIDILYSNVVSVADNLQEKSSEYKTSMSYGISMNYYKYPLYEALKNARSLLLDEAKINRNTIACEFRKHSGSSLKFMLNKDEKELEIKSTFEKLIDIAVPENMVSATAHKLRENSVLWQSTNGDAKRLDAFFEKIMGLGEKGTNENKYLITVKQLLNILISVDEKKRNRDFDNRYAYELQKIIDENQVEYYQLDQANEFAKEKSKKDIEENKKESNERINQYIYSMLRVAKFINGEEIKK